MYFEDERPWDPQTLQRLDEHIDRVVKRIQSDANGLLTVLRERKLGDQAVAEALKSKETICAEVRHVAKCKEFSRKSKQSVGPRVQPLVACPCQL